MGKVIIQHPSVGNSPSLLVSLSSKPEDRFYLHYVVEFRVVVGFIELFGTIYGPSVEYTTVVAPSWFGCYSVNVASLSSLDKDRTDSIPEVDGACCHCGGYCGAPSSLLCDRIAALSQKSEAIILFKNAETAFGSCPAQYMVSKTPAFNNVCVDSPKWYTVVQQLLYDIFVGLNADKPCYTPGLSRPVLVFGAKSSGKSTFCCFLINTLLSIFEKVAFLDTDMGQPLFTAPGLVSSHLVSGPLIGAPHSFVYPASTTNDTHTRHVQQLHSVFAYGTSPEVDPSVYLGAVGQCHLKYQQFIAGALHLGSESKTGPFVPHAQPAKLLKKRYVLGRLIQNLTCDTRHSGGLTADSLARLRNAMLKFIDDPATAQIPVPLVVNTHGWVTGLGWQLIDAIGALTWASWGIEISVSSKEVQRVVSQESNREQRRSSLPLSSSPLSSSPSSEKEDIETKQMSVSSPFTDVIQSFCGRFPLPWLTSSAVTVRRVQRESVNIKGVIKRCTASAAELRWLRFMALFNPAYRRAVHFPAASEEEFFHGALMSPLIKSPRLAKQRSPKLIALKLWDSEGSFRLRLSCPGICSFGNSSISDALFLLTGALVALCRSENESAFTSQPTGDGQATGPRSFCTTVAGVPTAVGKASESIPWIAARPWPTIGYGWVHSVDMAKGEVYIYIPASLHLAECSLVNILSIGYRFMFSPLPETFVGSPPFPDVHVIQEALRVNSTMTAVSEAKGLTPALVDTLNSLPLRTVTGGSLSTVAPAHTPYQQEYLLSHGTGGKRPRMRNLLPRACHSKLQG